tara:strand:+ start:504 stop:1064 length:561 start_codon:yes stop_codon:yes gene_type:complete
MLYLTKHYESDIAIVITALESINLRTSTDRREAYRQFYRRLPPKDSYSVQYGYTKKKWLSSTSNRIESKYPGLYNTTLKTDEPELEILFNEFFKLYCPEKKFKWTEIQINKNHQIQPHRDKGNVGESYIIGFGNYSGGQLKVSNELIDIKDKFYKFDGTNNTHYTLPFKGDRYSIVFFNNSVSHLH